MLKLNIKGAILIFVSSIVAFSSCKKDSITNIPVEKSFTDPSESLGQYKAQLATGENGWNVVIAPADAGLQAGYFKFNANGEAQFVTDITASSASTPVSSKYTLSVIQNNPTLSFGKTSGFSALVAASQLKIDTSFTFQSIKGDTINLSGNIYGSSLKLIKASKQQSDDFLAGRIMTSVQSVVTMTGFKQYFKRLNLEGKLYDLILDVNNGLISINYMSNGTFKNFVTYYAYVADGIVLKDPLIDGNNVIGSLSNLQVNTANSSATVTISGKSGTISNESVPVAMDLQAATRFYNNPVNGSYWQTFEGFTVEGVPDYYNVASISGFDGITLYLQVSPPYDAVLFWTTAGAYYGPAFSTSLTSDGKIRFTYVGNLRSAPSSVASIVNATRIQFSIPEGFYVIPTRDGHYDLVNAKDAKAWISF